MRFGRDHIVDRWQAAQIADHRLDVLVRQIAVGARRHRRTQQAAVGPLSFADRQKYLIVGPLADAGLRIGRDIGRDRGEIGVLDDIAASEFLILQRTLWSLRRMTIATSSKRLDEIPAAFERGLGSTRRWKEGEQYRDGDEQLSH